MKKLLVFIISLALFFPSISMAAIAFDAAGQGSSNVGTLTYSFTATTTADRDLVVGVQTAGVVPSSVTFNGVTSTLISSTTITGGSTFTTAFLYNLVNPSSGTFNIVVNTGSGFTYSGATSYTGVNQTTPVDVHAEHFSTSTSNRANTTTTVNNDWLVGYAAIGSSFGTCNAGASSTLRVQVDVSIWGCMIDSNAARATGANFIESNVNATPTTLSIVALEPTQAPVPTPTTCHIRGLGRCH